MYKEELFAIEDYSILMQYLAMDGKIKINNGIADLEIWMEEDYNIKALNLNFKEFPAYDFNEEMSLKNVLLGIIPDLKKQKPEEFKTFKNRWEEIKNTTIDNVAFNKL